MNLGDIVAAGALGAVQGAGEGAAQQALIEQKAQIEALREQRLSQLRTQEHAANTASDIAAKQAQADQQAQRTADFFKTNTLPSTTSTVSPQDAAESGGTLTEDATTTTTPSPRDQAANYVSKALATGRPEIMGAADTYQKNVLSAQDMDRKNALEAGRVAIEGQRGKYYDALVDEISAKTKALQEGLSTKYPAPEITRGQDPNGAPLLVDKRSGAYALFVPAKDAKPAVSHIFGADEPAAPAVAAGFEWHAADGTPLKGAGLGSIYPEWAARMQAGGPAAAKARAQAPDAGSDITSDILAAAGGGGGGSPSPAASGGGGGAGRPAPPPVVKSGNVTARFTGRYSPTGRPIYQDASGNQFLGQ